MNYACQLIYFLFILCFSWSVQAQDSLYLPSKEGVKYYSNFVLKYNDLHEIADWVVYELTDVEAQGKLKRSNNFRPDNSILGGSAELNDYRKSGYDRGHLAPAGDMAFSSKAMSECFYLSNIVPQVPNMNRGRWRQLENLVRNWAIERGKIYLVTGVIVNSGNSSIGKNQVKIPSALYKAIYDPTRKEMIAFLIPNRKISSNEDLFSFLITVDEIERKSGIDLFPQLIDSTENQLESTIDFSSWKIR